MKKYKLGDPRNFHYLNQSNCYEVANVDDAREYLETRNAMDILGISQDDQVFVFCINKGIDREAAQLRLVFLLQEAIFRVVAAVLHLGNIDFVKGKEVDSSKLKDEKSRFHLITAAELLMYEF